MDEGGTVMSISFEERISRYMAKLDASISGQNGHSTLLHAAGVLVIGFALTDDVALPFLIEYNDRAMPPWPHSVLKRKLKEARKRPKKPIGYLLGGKVPEILVAKPIEEPPHKKPDLSRFRKGYARELEQMSTNRGWSVEALHFAQSAGILRFGPVCKFDCWVAMDASGICAEARRLDDKWFPPFRSKDRDREERKAHAIYGSKKSWPVGLRPVVAPENPLYSIAMFEGDPDLLSAFHFLFLQKRTDVLPVSMLGCTACIHNFHPDAIDLLRGRRVRIYPHNDHHGQGLHRALHWAKQLVELGCKPDFFTFDDVFKPDGKPANDLTECVGKNLEELFP
jgi:hypothetical protein